MEDTIVQGALALAGLAGLFLALERVVSYVNKGPRERLLQLEQMVKRDFDLMRRDLDSFKAWQIAHTEQDKKEHLAVADAVNNLDKGLTSKFAELSGKVDVLLATISKES